MKKKHQFILITLLLFGYTNTQAVDYYWKANAVNNDYQNISNWDLNALGSGISPGVAPGPNDNVYFIAIPATTATILTTGTTCSAKNLICTANYNIIVASPINIYGSIMASNGTLNFVYGSPLGAIALLGSGTHTIDMGSLSVSTGSFECAVSFNSSGGTYQLASDLISSNSISFSNGNFMSNGKNIIGTTLAVSSAVRTIDWEGSEVRCNTQFNSYTSSGPTATTFSTSSTRLITPGMSFTGNSCSVQFQSITINNTHAFSYIDFPSNSLLSTDSLILSCLSFKLRGGGSGSSFLFHNMVLNNPSCAIENLASSIATGTINNIIVSTATCPSRLLFKSTTQLLTLQTPGLTVNNVDFYGINAVGGTITDINGKDMGFNSGIAFTGTVTSTSFYWIGGTGNWDNPAHWSSTSGGAPNAGACLPTSVDDVFFDVNSFPSSNQVVTINPQGAYCHSMMWSDPARAGSLSGADLFISGSVDFTGCKNVLLNEVSFTGIGAETITMGGSRAGSSTSCNFVIDASGSYTLQDSLVLTGGAFKHASGYFNSNTKAMSIPVFNNSASTGGPSLYPRHLNIANSKITITAQNWTLDTDSLKSFNASGSHLMFTRPNSKLEVMSTYLIPPAIRVNFWDVTFLGLTDVDQITTKSGVKFCRFNDITFTSNGLIADNNTADSLYVHDIYLSSGYQYNFHASTSTDPIYTFSGGFVFPNIPCQDMLTLQSTNDGIQAKLYKASGTFALSGSITKDINAVGVPLIVNNGMDYGNNTNVIITPNNYRKMYWVGGTGNWNDPTHWSIGVSGASYPTNTNTNPDGCLPRPVDDVFFDANSFTAPLQSVTISGMANCLNMLWTSAQTPSLKGTGADALNIYGSIQLADNMTAPFSGKINFYANTVNPPNTTTFKNVILHSGLNFIGKGRWDLQDSIMMAGGGITFNSGQLYTHKHTIRTGFFSANSASTRTLDISHSSVYTSSGGYNVNHNNLHFKGDSTNMYMLSGTGVSMSGMPNATYHYHNFYFMSPSRYALNAGGLNIVCNKIFFNTATAGNFTGNFNVDTLVLGQSQAYYIYPNNKIFIKDTLIGSGTPCDFSTIASSAAGQKAYLQHSRCNTALYFYNINDVNAVSSSSCIVNNYHVYGNNINNNSNWNFHSSVAVPGLGRDTTVSCKELPYVQSTVGFGVASSYLWSNNSTNDTLIVPDALIYPGTATYSVFVSYTNGCYLSDSRTLQVLNTLKADTILTPLTCFNAGNGKALIRPSGGSGIYTIQFGSTNPFNRLNDSTINGLVAGNYYAVMTQSNSKVCKDSVRFTITQPNLLVAPLSSASVTCYGATTGSLYANPSGGNGGYLYTWTNGLNTYTTQNAMNVKAGHYTLTVTDSKGCVTNSVVAVKTVSEALTATVSGSTTATCDETNGAITISVTGGIPGYHYVWSTGVSGSTELNQLAAGNYTFIVTDANTCKDTLVVMMNCDIQALIPELFSPNGDGKNDKFEIKSLNYYPNNTLSVFNRWGSLVYTKHQYDNAWDGRANVGDAQGGAILPVGTYYVVLDFGSSDLKPYCGFVQLEY